MQAVPEFALNCKKGSVFELLAETKSSWTAVMLGAVKSMIDRNRLPRPGPLSVCNTARKFPVPKN